MNMLTALQVSEVIAEHNLTLLVDETTVLQYAGKFADVETALDKLQKKGYLLDTVAELALETV